VLVAFLVADAAQAAEKLSDSSSVAQCMRMLRNAFRPTHVPEPAGSFVTRWDNDPFARGAYSFFKVGSSRADCEALSEPLGWRRLNVGFAGEATAMANMGSVLVRLICAWRHFVPNVFVIVTGGLAVRRGGSQANIEGDVTTYA